MKSDFEMKLQRLRQQLALEQARLRSLSGIAILSLANTLSHFARVSLRTQGIG
jgi:hypothetical protein